jgi:periplasmic protein CpxP/Spy
MKIASITRNGALALILGASLLALPAFAQGVIPGTNPSPAVKGENAAPGLTTSQNTTPGAGGMNQYPSSPTPAATPAAAPAKASKHGNPSDRVEARIKTLHSELKITPAQDAQWNAVAQAMRQDAATMTDLIQQRQANAANMSAVDDLASYGKITQAHADGVKSIVGPFSTLYASFSDAQKKTADAVFSRGPRSGKAPKAAQ